MAEIPLIKDSKDIHYRYKMPKLAAKVEGSGNGIKTVIVNMNAIAKALNRPPAYVTKFFGIELGAIVSMHKNEHIVNGSHDADKLLLHLYAFIKKFVLCPKCSNPETDLSVVGKQIHQKCIACGYQGLISSTHKLTSYIINHPPTPLGVTPAPKSSKEERKHTKRSSAAVVSESVPVKLVPEDRFSDEDDFDSDEQAVKLSAELSNVDIKTPAEKANVLFKLVKERKEENKLADANVQKEIFNEAVKLEMRDKATLILSEVLFSENILQELKEHRVLVLRFCDGNTKAQKYLLNAVEILVGDVYKEKLFGKVLFVLKALYDYDIVDEEVFFEWASKVSKKYVSKEIAKEIRDKAAPFIKWLKEAEVEEDEDHKNGDAGEDDEDDDDDIDIEYSHRVNGIQVETVKSEEKKQEDAADFDIDEI